MASVKVAITLEQETLRQVDNLVARRVFQNRSRAIQIALHEKIERVEGSRLAAECAKLIQNLSSRWPMKGWAWMRPHGQNSKRRDSLCGSEPRARS